MDARVRTATPVEDVFTPVGVHAKLARRIYRYRMLGMGLGAVMMAAVLLELEAGPVRWALCVLTGLAWPQIAWLRSQRSPDDFRAEQGNLLVDSTIAALWVPLLHFNLLPSVMLLALSAADKINTDVPGLLRRSIPFSLLAILAGGLATGFAFQPHTSTMVILASLPMMLIHTWMVTRARQQLVRKVLRKNEELVQLGRTDVVTGLARRGFWEHSATAALQAAHARPQPAVLVLVDMDGFKEVNDRYGHVAGDALLRHAGSALRGLLRGHDIAGRYGGDEFAVVCPDTSLDEALAIAEAYLAAVEGITLVQAPGHAHSVSIGIALLRPGHVRIEDWIDAADAALYEAKREGRNRVVVSRDSADQWTAAS